MNILQMYLETIYHDRESHQWSLEQKLKKESHQQQGQRREQENIFTREFDASFPISKWCTSIIDPSYNQVTMIF